MSPHAPRLPSEAGARLMGAAAIGSVAVSAALLAAKVVAYAMTGSVAILASLADSAIDLLASAINLFAVREALTPADREHRFGHGKLEPLAGLAQTTFIIGSTVFLIVESINHLVTPHPLTNGMVGIGIMVLSIAASSGLVAFQRVVIRRTGSPAISADSMHYAGDLVTNVAALLGIGFAVQFGWLRADPIAGLFVALILGASARSVFRQSYDQLMDRELPVEKRERIKSIVLTHPQIRGFHDLRTRKAGTLTFIQLHVEMDPEMKLARVHEISDEVEQKLLDAFPGAEVIIHQDPLGYETVPPLAQS